MKIDIRAGEEGLFKASSPLYKSYKLTLSEVINIVVTFLLVFLVLLEILALIALEGIYVVDSSMYPTLTGAVKDDLAGGDYVVIDKFSRVDYGDIVVVYNSLEKKNIIKRVVALGGDTVEMREGVLYLNGERREEPYLVHENVTPDKRVNSFAPHKLEAETIFLLGDNRDDSIDSRNRLDKQIADFRLSDVRGVVTDWSLMLKPLLTNMYTQLKFGG